VTSGDGPPDTGLTASVETIDRDSSFALLVGPVTE